MSTTRTPTRGIKDRGPAWHPVLATWVLLLTSQLNGATAQEDGWSVDKMFEVYGDIWTLHTIPTWPVLRIVSNTTYYDNVYAFWMGGVSQFYGAGSVSPIQSSSGILHPRFNAMIPGFGQTGARCLRPRLNTTLDDYDLRMRNVLINHVETILWASTILRDNLVTVFGYILNLPLNPLPTDLYTSLFHIYNEVRLRRFSTVDLVTELKDICRASTAVQLEKIFRKMKKVCRPYMESSIDVWLQALSDPNLHLDDILRPHGEPLVVDILEGIDPSVLQDLSRYPEFPSDVVATADPGAKEVLGGTVAYTLRALQTGTVPMTQTLFALLLLSRPLEDMDPQLTESERYVSDSLRLRTVRGWKEIARKAQEARASGAFAFAKVTLWALAESPEVEASLSDAARLVHSYVDPPVNTYCNPHYHFTSSIMSKPIIDVLKILKAITPLEYPDDVVDAKDRITYYIESGYLDIEFVVKGFNRFDHLKPIDVVIAILTRIERRLPKLPHEIRSSVKYLKVSLIFKKFLAELYPRIPEEFLESSFLLDSFEGPTMPKDIRSLVRQLDAKLSNVAIPVAELIDQIPIEECIRPRQCILNIYRRVARNGYVHGNVKDLILKLLSKLDINGDPLLPLELPEYEVKTDKKKKCLKNKAKIVKDVHIHTKTKTTKAKGKSPFEYVVIAEEDEEPDEEIQNLYPGPPEEPILYPVFNISEASKKPDYKHPVTLLPYTEVGSYEDLKIRPIREFLKNSHVYSHLGHSFRPKAYSTKMELLLAILKRAVVSSSLTYDLTLQNTLKEYLWFVENLPHHQDLIYQEVFPNVNEEWELSATNYEEPFKNLPPLDEGTLEYEKLQPIRWFLSQEDLYYQLGPYFRASYYYTKGSFVRNALNHALRLKSVRRNMILYITIKQYLSFLEDSHVHPLEVKKTPFPKRETIHDYEPPNWEHQLTLLPPTVSGTPEHVKLRPIRDFFKRKDFWSLLGSSFRPQEFRTKGELLIAILNQVLTIDFVKENHALASLTREYLGFLQNSWQGYTVGQPTIILNVDLLMRALPYPESSEEMSHYVKVKEYLKRPQFLTQVTPLLSQQTMRTRGHAMKYLVQRAMERTKNQVLENATFQALQYFKDRIFFDGYGAQAVDYVVQPKSLTQVRFDMFDLFRAFDHTRFSEIDRQRMKRVMKFVSMNFDPKKYLSTFEFEKYFRKGEFLDAAFLYMSKLEFLSPTLREDMKVLRSYILKTGPGAEMLLVLPEHRFE